MRLLFRVVQQARRGTLLKTVGNFSTVSDVSGVHRDHGGKGDASTWLCGSSSHIEESVRNFVDVQVDFINEEEEGAFLKELDLSLKKKKYEFDHWDDAIHGFRETERVQWGAVCGAVIGRLRAHAFPQDDRLLGPVHVLDLDKAGYIKPHVDSVKFCGNTIAGISLLSDSIMRLVHVDEKTHWVDLLLPRRSLYVLRDEARYKFTHEILKDAESVFGGKHIPRHRRISIICRNLPE